MGKKKGGGKGGGKGSDAAKEKKAKNRDVELLSAIANSQIMMVKLGASEKSVDEYRDSCHKMKFDNEKLHDTLYQAERDTIEVITYLKREDIIKDDQISQLNQMLRDVKQSHKEEKEEMVRDFTSKIVALEKSLADRTNEVKLMQGELKMVKEFRKKRSQMQAELDGIREGLFETNRDHKHALQRMEQKFFDEKLRLEQEAGQKLSELAERAHNEAIVKLDDTTRNVYKENVRLTEALRCHIKESEIVQKRFNALKLEADDLRDERELNIATMRHNVIDNKKKKIEVRALREKNTELELAISNMINDFDSARTQVEENTKLQLANSNGEIQNLEKLLSMKSREANRVKLVARNIIEQRSDLEVFFHEALRQIREEISSSRAQYIAAAKDAYNQRMIDAHTGAANFPKVRTFGKANESSTNSIFADLQGAADTSKLVGKVDIRDLTWEQKEKVLRLLFARMNRVRTAKVATPQVLPKAPKLGPNSEEIAKEIFKPIDGDDDAYGVSTTFLTQQPVSTNLNPILPPIESKT